MSCLQHNRPGGGRDGALSRQARRAVHRLEQRLQPRRVCPARQEDGLAQWAADRHRPVRTAHLLVLQICNSRPSWPDATPGPDIIPRCVQRFSFFSALTPAITLSFGKQAILRWSTSHLTTTTQER
jgi:hypothetical protein